MSGTQPKDFYAYNKEFGKRGAQEEQRYSELGKTERYRYSISIPRNTYRKHVKRRQRKHLSHIWQKLKYSQKVKSQTARITHIKTGKIQEWHQNDRLRIWKVRRWKLCAKFQ